MTEDVLVTAMMVLAGFALIVAVIVVVRMGWEDLRDWTNAGNKQLDGACADCGRRYGGQYGFPDLMIEDWAWARISPRGNEGGLLCPSCICRRLSEHGITCHGEFMSGPLSR